MEPFSPSWISYISQPFHQPSWAPLCLSSSLPPCLDASCFPTEHPLERVGNTGRNGGIPLPGVPPNPHAWPHSLSPCQASFSRKPPCPSVSIQCSARRSQSLAAPLLPCPHPSHTHWPLVPFSAQHLNLLVLFVFVLPYLPNGVGWGRGRPPPCGAHHETMKRMGVTDRAPLPPWVLGAVVEITTGSCAFQRHLSLNSDTKVRFQLLPVASISLGKL